MPKEAKIQPKGPKATAKKASRPVELLKVNRALGTDGAGQFCGGNDGKAFVLMKLLPRCANPKAETEKQMVQIEELDVGTKFWLRRNNNISCTEDAPPEPAFGAPAIRSFNMPTEISARDRINKKKLILQKKINKVARAKSACNKWQLMIVVAL